jgi:uncharacterized protein (TIGR02246 family)
VLTESGDVHRSEDVGYRIQCSLPIWTNRQTIRTSGQFSSTSDEIYSLVLDATHQAKGAVMEQKQIEQLIEKYVQGINQSSADALIQLFTHDGVVMAPEAPTMEGTDQLKALFNHTFSTTKLNAKIYIDEIVVSENHAYARCHSEVKMTVAQNTLNEENRELFILRKDNGVWKIARYMFNKKLAVK